MIRMKDICVSFRSERQDKIFGHTKQQILFDVSVDVKKVTCRDMKEILKEIDPEFLKGTLEPKGTKEQIYENATDQELVDVIKALVE